jgi:tetratricopeptide (TPR) repeat protein
MICFGLMAGVQPAAANVLEELLVQPGKADNVVRIRFNTRIHFVRYAAAENSSAVQVYFQIVEGREQQLRVEESLRSRSAASLPGLTVALPPQPGVQTKRLLIKFTRRTEVLVRPGPDDRSLDIVFEDVGKSVIKDSRRYAVRLLASPNRDELGTKVVPARFADFDLYTSQRTVDGKIQYELHLGYLPTADAAEKLRRQLLTRFPDAAVVDLASRKQQTLAAVAGTRPEPEVPQPAPGAIPEVEAQAVALMKQARAALESGNNEQAVGLFNQLLFLPPNSQSQEGQELIGLARERNGELAKAKTEYELYLKLFPEGEGALRVRERLAALPQAAAAPRGEAAQAPAAERVVKSISGSVSQYYYGGQSRIQTAFSTPTTIDQSTISSVDQSLLVTNVDLNGRYRNATSDQRIVIRDTYNWSFLDSSPSRNRLTSAYYEYKGLQDRLGARIGRQTGYSGGLPSRFDGALLGYGFLPKFKFNLAAGLPVEFPAIESDRQFWGVSLDAENLDGHWSGNVFFIDQWVDDISDRRAAGGEIRYFDDHRSLYTLVDYDISYNLTNIAMVQGSWQTAGQTTFSLLLDRRRAPTLSTNNALYNGTVTAMTPVPTTIKQLLNTFSEDQIRTLAEDATAVAYQAQLGVTTPLNATWQLGADFGLTNIGALPQVTLDDGTVLEPSPATGNIYNYVLRAIGTNLFSGRDIHVFSLSYTRAAESSPAFDGIQVAYNNTTYLGDKWSLEPSLKFYAQHTDPETDLKRWTPGIRLSYRIKETLSLDAEYIFEYADTTSPGAQDVSQTHYASIGYRWDF